jgi:hypothetical protein
MIIIDDESFDVPFVQVTRKADVLDKYAERTADGVLHREIIGVYYNYSAIFGAILDRDEYQRLWDKLTEPTEFHTVTVPGTDGDYTYTAYISSVSDKLRRIKDGDKIYWSELTANFIAQSPARS